MSKRCFFFFYVARVYFHKRNLTQHVKSSHEGKKYECTYPECGTKLCTQVSRIEVNRITFFLQSECVFRVTFNLYDICM